jgi:hypothetical protein
LIRDDALNSSLGGRTYWRWISFLLCFFALSLLNWGSGFLGYSGPSLRFDISGLNTFFGLFTLSIPWVVFALLVKSRPFRTQTLLVLLLIPVILLTIPAGLLEFAFLTADEPLKTVDMGRYRVGLHLLNCGAPCSFMIAVDQERIVVPPLMLSKRLYVFDPAFDARTEALGKDVLRVTTLPYNDEHPQEQTQVFHMKPHFFF